MSDKEPKTLAEMSNAEFLLIFWMISRRESEGCFNITGRRPYCRR